MANITETIQHSSSVKSDDYPELTRNFELFYTFAMLWLLGGAYADGWSHSHIPELEAVFTPAHIFLYTGAGLLAGFVVYQAVKNYAMGFSIFKVLPFGYHNAIWGVIIFSTAGPGDLLWHSIFGVEQNIEATFSPTHFAAMIGIFLIYSAPLVARIKRTPPMQHTSFLEALPAIVSATAMLSLLTLITTWANPFGYLFPASLGSSMSRDINQGFGMVAIMFQTIFLMALVLFTLKDHVLPVGSYSFILGVNGILVQVMNYHFYLIFVSLITGLTIDFLYNQIKPSKNRVGQFRLVGFLVPIIWWGLYFSAVALFETVWWSAHTWTGAVFIPGVIGLLLSYLIVPIEYIEPV